MKLQVSEQKIVEIKNGCIGGFTRLLLLKHYVFHYFYVITSITAFYVLCFN
jgi:hypothetical protein